MPLFNPMSQAGGLGAQQPRGLMGGLGSLFGGGTPGEPNYNLMALGSGISSGDMMGAFERYAPMLQQVRSRNMTKAWLMKKGISAEDADIYAANPTLLNEALQGKKRNLINAGDGRLYDADTGEWITAPGAGQQGQNDYQQRLQAAQEFGMKPDDPAYKSFVLTGKMPREDQGPLTAVDKKAILDADDMVAANENAVQALDQAVKLSDKANSGWFAGARASAGNNLPDWMVPDAVSSPDSSQATADLDNAVIGQALVSLRTIFGGNPTEGERKVLLDLQGSSSMPADVRKSVYQRAKALAERRLAFNKQRADELRGQTYYKQGGMSGSGADGWTDLGNGVRVRPMASP